MAINPLAARGRDENTLSMTDLLRIPVRDRVEAARTSSSFVDMILNALTPIQIAQAFPDYYRQSLPDVSNFITKNIEAKLAAAGRGWDQTGGGEPGTARPDYTGETKTGSKRPSGVPQPTIEEMKKSLLSQGIDISGIYSAIGNDGISADDDRVKYLQSMTDEDLSKTGLQRVKGEDGKITIKMMTPEAQALSDEEVLKRASGKVAEGTGNLEGKQKLQKQVYDSFVNAGFSDNQAKALTAEVGRENDFSERYVYGKHVDANNSKVNLGFFSWQGSRGKALYERLKSKGLIDENGAIIQSQESLDEMAAFTKDEMENIPDYDRTKRQFLDNPDISQQEAAEVLGNNFIRWDMAGKKIDPGPHMRKRDEYYAQIESINKEFPGLVPENATPDQIAAARDKLIAEERTQEADNLTRLLFSKNSSTSSQPSSAQGMDLETSRSTALSFLDNTDRNPDGANLGDVDERLLEIAEMGIKKFEAENPNLKVEIYGPGSGKRQTSKTKKSQHLYGKALDFEIFEIDPETGKKIRRLANFANQAGAGEAADDYLRLHQNIELARIYKKDVIKDNRYSDIYGRSGALFGGNYALDTQHYDIGGSAGTGLESADQPGGSIFGGYNQEYINRFGIQDSAALVQDDLLEASKLAYGPRTDLNSNVAATEEIPATQSDSTSTTESEENPYLGMPLERLEKMLDEEIARGYTLAEGSEESYSSQKKRGLLLQEIESNKNYNPDSEEESEAEEPQQMAQGGFINEKDNLSVVNEDGDTLAKINEGEMIGGMLTEGTGMRVVSNNTRLADDIVERNNIDSPVQQTAMEQPNIPLTASEKPPGITKNPPMKEDQNWREMVTNDTYQRGTQIRAFRRTKFMPEGYHFNRASPSSIA